MSRVAQILNRTKIAALAMSLVVLVGIVGAVTSWDATPKPVITKQQSQTTYVKYQGVEGQTALELLKKYADVKTKHYSFGDLVISINGTAGNGPKYWSFYVNGKLSDVGAGSYVAKSTDNIEWKLQAL